MPPEVFDDFGDDDLADSDHSIRVTIDLLAAVGSNLYADAVTQAGGGWLTQKKVTEGVEKRAEEISYKFIGATENGLLAVVAGYNGGGSGTFYTLHILDATAGRAFDGEGKLYDRLDLTDLRNVILGDRWGGDIAINGDIVSVTTAPDSLAFNPSRATMAIEARRP